MIEGRRGAAGLRKDEPQSTRLPVISVQQGRYDKKKSVRQILRIKEKRIGKVCRLTECPRPSSRHWCTVARQRHQASQILRQRWSEADRRTAREGYGVRCNGHRPEPAPQSTHQPQPSRKAHSDHPPTACDRDATESHARDDEPAARAPATGRPRGTTPGRNRSRRWCLLQRDLVPFWLGDQRDSSQPRPASSSWWRQRPRRHPPSTLPQNLPRHTGLRSRQGLPAEASRCCCPVTRDREPPRKR